MADRKSTRLNSSHTVIYTLSLHDALPIYLTLSAANSVIGNLTTSLANLTLSAPNAFGSVTIDGRSEEHTSELQSHSDLHSFPTRRSSDLFDALGRQFRHRQPDHQPRQSDAVRPKRLRQRDNRW